MLKETLLYMLFIGAVVCAAYFLKENKTQVQSAAIVMDDEHFPYTRLTDTLRLK